MQLTSILKTRAAYGGNLQVTTSIDQKARDFGDYSHTFIWIINEPRSDQDKRKWKRSKGCQNHVKDELPQIKWLHIVDTTVAKWGSTERQYF